MSHSDPNEPFAEELTVSKKTEIPWIWLLPLVAFLISVWLIYKSAAEKGLLITIDFPTAEGIEVDKTKIRYLDVEIGKVTEVSIEDNQKTIRVTAQMNSNATDYLKESTSFWVVRPQVGIGGISGLGTLLSGPYIELKPGEGRRRVNFTGLTQPPALKNHVEGKQYTLKTSELGSLRSGTPISFHGIAVGEVIGYKLSDDGNAILLNIFINSPYHQFVRKNTRFWIDSGIDLSAGADGFKVRTGPLISLLGGGIAFRASGKDSIADIKPELSQFTLYDSYERSAQLDYTNALKYVMYFSGSVRGLSEGAPVQLRGIPIGRVTDISLEIDKTTSELRIPVMVELEPDRIRSTDGDNRLNNDEIMTSLIRKGLRARLQTGSLVTGQLLVDLDFQPNSKIYLHPNFSHVPEFPTTASTVEELTQSAQKIMDKLAKLPLEQMSGDISKTLKNFQETSQAATITLNSAHNALVTAQDTLMLAQGIFNNTNGTLKSAQDAFAIIQPGSTGYYEFHKLLQETTQAATAVKRLADYLEQHPESLLQGKKPQSAQND